MWELKTWSPVFALCSVFLLVYFAFILYDCLVPENLRVKSKRKENVMENKNQVKSNILFLFVTSDLFYLDHSSI